MSLPEYYRELNKHVNRLLADPEAPYVLYYFKAHKDGKLKLFDLHHFDEGYTIGEICLPNCPPIQKPEAPPTQAASGLYVHFNYGWVEGNTPTEAFEKFNKERKLALENIREGKPTYSLVEMIEQMQKLILMLHAENCLTNHTDG